MQGFLQTLVIDDNPYQSHDLSVILNFIGELHQVSSSGDLDGELLQNHAWKVCLLGQIDSIDSKNRILHLLRTYPQIPVVTLSDHHDLFSCLPNYITSIEMPLQYKQLFSAFQRCNEYCDNYIIQVSAINRKNFLFRSMVGTSAAIGKVRHFIEQVASSDQNVLILGELGTGKEVAARHIHYHSLRREKPFVVLKTSTASPQSVERMLFGSEDDSILGDLGSGKGCLELAQGGTLFIDEIADMPLPIQMKLLKVLEQGYFECKGSGEVHKMDVRLVTASYRNLQKMMSDNLFCGDLYRHLNSFSIEMPALRQRIDDLPLLLQELLTRLEATGMKRIHLTSQAIELLMLHNWPGNIRELASFVKQLSAIYPEQVIDANLLASQYRYLSMTTEKAVAPIANGIEQEALNVASDRNTAMVGQELPEQGINLKDVLAELEINLIKQALVAQSRVVTNAAEMLGMRRTTLIEKMRKYGLTKDG